MSTKTIPLFYWSEIKFIFKKKENYGDLLSKYLVEKISGKEVKWVHPKKQPWYTWNKINFLAIGSIIHHATTDSIVWGSGIIDNKHKVAAADFKAVRGPRTREFLINSGYKCPPVFGDPALLLPKYFNPDVDKRYKLGVIPHYHDYKQACVIFENFSEILVIDLMTMDVEEVTRKILQCGRIISSSLHGLIVAHAYQIPGIWVEFSKKIFGDGIKYQDYLESVDILFYQAPRISGKFELEDINHFFKRFPILPVEGKVEELQKGLMESCPFSSLS